MNKTFSNLVFGDEKLLIEKNGYEDYVHNPLNLHRLQLKYRNNSIKKYIEEVCEEFKTTCKIQKTYHIFTDLENINFDLVTLYGYKIEINDTKTINHIWNTFMDKDRDIFTEELYKGSVRMQILNNNLIIEIG
jgi:hypothetical protein